MADVKHTPGPLEAHSSIYEGMCAEVRCVEPGRERGVAQVWNHPNGFYDAQLYAAAPDMLAALNLALEYWAHRQQRYKNRHPVWVENARAAIAKATGDRNG